MQVSRDAATIAKLNDTLQGKPSVKTQALAAEILAREQAELAEQLAQFEFLDEDGEVLDHDVHILAVAEEARERYGLVELDERMLTDICEFVETGAVDDKAQNDPEKALREFMYRFGVDHDLDAGGMRA